MNRSILHRWRQEGMAASIHRTRCRSEPARDGLESAGFILNACVIVDDHREQARSHNGCAHNTKCVTDSKAWSEPARDEFNDTAEYQVPRVIVDPHREQAASGRRKRALAPT